MQKAAIKKDKIQCQGSSCSAYRDDDLTKIVSAARELSTEVRRFNTSSNQLTRDINGLNEKLNNELE